MNYSDNKSHSCYYRGCTTIICSEKCYIYEQKKKTDSILTVISFEKLTYSQRIIFRPKINDKDFFLLL